MPSEAQYLRGTDTPASERIHLQAGPLDMVFEPSIGFLRYIRFGDQEILRGLYSAVRDHNWDTIAPKLTDLSVDVSERCFDINFNVAHSERDIDFRWRGEITGTEDGTVTFSMDGEAQSDFKRNRIGFCVLHSPAHVAGKPCTVLKDDGTEEQGRFPEQISPHQPFLDMRAIRHEVVAGVTAEVRFEGDVFEMEDQRNWTDASYKTYCTPLANPYPVDVAAGTKIRQSVTISVSSWPDVVNSVSEQVVVLVNPADRTPLPEIGLGCASQDEELSEDQVLRLQTLHLSHLRVDARLSEPGWETAFQGAAREASAIGVALEVAAYVSDAASAELDALAACLAGCDTPVVRVLVFHIAEIAANRRWIDLARGKLSKTGASIVSGANAYFTELNRNRPDFNALDGVCYSLNPQVHAFDDASLMETLVAQGWTVESTRAFAGPLPIHVSPVTLLPRFNPNATGPESDLPEGELPSSVDARQMSLLGAAWTVGSLKYLTRSGASTVTYFETTGWKGVMDSERGSPSPFPSVTDGTFPMAHVFAWFGGMKDGHACLTESTVPLKLDALALMKGEWIRILVANLTAEKQSARINCPGLSGAVRIEPLDEHVVERATAEPWSFRSRKDITNMETSGGSFVVDLNPYAVLCVKGQIAD
jgi:hypothetical protein